MMREVTPIKVRGKKSKTLKQTHNASTLPLSAVPRKRLIQDDDRSPGARSYATGRESRPSSGRVTPRRVETYHHATPRRPFSIVEQLPTEILEQIFVYTLNVSFARSSHIIGAKLSSLHTYQAFGGHLFGCFKDQHGNRYDTNGALTDIPRDLLLKARNEALQCRWMTGATFRALRNSRILAERARLGTVFSRRWKAYEAHNKLLRIDLGDKCYIPARILRSPITPDRQDLLEQLYECGATIDWVNSTAGESAQDLWKYTMSIHDWPLADLLSDLGVGHQEGDRPARWIISNSCWDFHMLAKVAKLYPRETVPPGLSLDTEACRRHTLWFDPLVAAEVFERNKRDTANSEDLDEMKKVTSETKDTNKPWI